MKIKSLLTTSAIAMALISTSALADHHEKSDYSDKDCKAKHHSKPDNKEYFKHVDINKDGKITRAEFTDAADKRFAKMDKNGDGVLDKSDRKRNKDENDSSMSR